jgi:phage terminase large subunit-like protein
MAKKMTPEEMQAKLERIALLERKAELREGLPHLYGQKFYPWAREFFESTNRNNFLVAANQIGKSSVNIRKCINWATSPDLWPKLWRNKPIQFWYLMPTRTMCEVEWVTKWVPEFMPRGKYKDHPVYGWHEEKTKKEISSIRFNSGVIVYFKTYSQDTQSLQAGTVSAVFCDEELPEELFDEINMRRAATDGYFHLVFTATLGQELWRRTMEEKGEKEMFPDAFKRQVSMWDCLKFDDGTESHWSPSRIKRIERGCKSPAEVQRRVYGRFVKDEGLKYPGFDRTINVKPVKPVPTDWLVYGGVDVGGGQGSHPSAITLVAVSPDYTEGRVIGGWRGDNVLTTAGDVLTKYFELTSGLNVTAAYYDYSAKDFSTIANRMGVTFNPANKSHDVGEQIINVLFRNEMMAIDDLDENISLVTELCTLGIDTPKTKARDDRVDSFRYAVSSIPWNFAKISELRRVKLLASPTLAMSQEEMGRRGLQMNQTNELDVFIDEEFEAFNELYEA